MIVSYHCCLCLYFRYHFILKFYKNSGKYGSNGVNQGYFDKLSFKLSRKWGTSLSHVTPIQYIGKLQRYSPYEELTVKNVGNKMEEGLHNILNKIM